MSSVLPISGGPDLVFGRWASLRALRVGEATPIFLFHLLVMHSLLRPSRPRLREQVALRLLVLLFFVVPVVLTLWHNLILPIPVPILQIAIPNVRFVRNVSKVYFMRLINHLYNLLYYLSNTWLNAIFQLVCTFFLMDSYNYLYV